jgi:preprotein translocase subunit SecY
MTAHSKLPLLAGLQELKKRLFFVFVAIIVYRIGAHIPVPGLDPEKLVQLFSQKTQGLIAIFNLFSGGAFSHFTLFALGLLPYISVSIIVQLLSVVVPSLEQLKKEGELGRRKLNQYTRYGTVLLASIHSFALSKWLVSQGVAWYPGYSFYFTAMVTLVAGTLFLMWLGEQISERGIGNGISLIIFSGIVSGLPIAVLRFFEQVRQGQIHFFALLFIAVVMIGIIAFVVFIEKAQRKITIHYSQRQQGRRMYTAQASYLPLKINIAGVMPPIFTSSIMVVPSLFFEWFGNTQKLTWLQDLVFLLAPGKLLYLLLFSLGIIFFSFFYTALIFNPRETSENLKKSGAFVPGIRPGEQTARYIDLIMTRLTLAGCFYLLLVVLLPDFIVLNWQAPFSLGGTSLLIIVTVIIEFIAQVQSLIMSHQYESLLKKTNLKH